MPYGSYTSSRVGRVERGALSRGPVAAIYGTFGIFRPAPR
jgi:hypothetical protein